MAFVAGPNGKLYAMGGRSDSADLSTVEEYDPQTNTWTSRASMPGTRSFVGGVMLNGLIYVLGGAGAGGTFEYDPAANTWATQPGTLVAHGGAGAATVGGKLYVAGGTNTSGMLASFEEGTPTFTSATPTPTSTSTVTPTPTSTAPTGPANYRTYVVNNGNRLSVIDPSNFSVVGHIPLTNPSGGYAVAVNSAGTRAYVANRTGDNVAVVDLVAQQEIATVPLGAAANPHGVAVSPDGTRVYVTNYHGGGPGTLSIIDATTTPPTVLRTLNVGLGPLGVAVNPSGTRVYVANWGWRGQPGNTISVIDTTSNPPSVVHTVTVSTSPANLVVSPDGTRVYVQLAGPDTQPGNTVAILDATANPPSVIGSINVGTLPLWGIAVNPAGTRLYVANNVGDSLTVIDLSATPPAALSTVSVGDTPLGVVVSPDGTRVYVVNESSSTISVFDATVNPPALLATPGTGSFPAGIAVGAYSAAPTSTPTATPTATITPTKTSTPTPTPSETPTVMPSATASNTTTPTMSPTGTPTSTPTATATATTTSTTTATATNTATPTAVATGPMTLTAAKAGTGVGTVTSGPAGINCGQDCSQTYAQNTVVTLTAAASSGSTFAGWSGACTNASGTCTVTMDAAKGVTATFTDLTKPVRISGKVLNGTQPVANVQVSALCLTPGGLTCTGVVFDGKTTSDGTYVVHGPLGKYDLYLGGATGYGSTATTYVDASVGSEYSGLNLAVASSVTIAGTVTNTFSPPETVAGAGVAVTIPRQAVPGGVVTIGSATTTATGGYSLKVAPGSYTVTLSRAGYPVQAPSTLTVTGAMPANHYTIAAYPVKITGRVLNGTAGVKDLTPSVQCAPASGTTCAFAFEGKTATDGSFVLRGERGTYDVFLLGGANVTVASAIATWVDATSAGGYAGRDIAVATAVSVGGQVTDAYTGAGVGSSKLAIAIPRQGTSGTVTSVTITTAAGGTYTTKLAPGSYSATLTKTGYLAQPPVPFTVSGATSSQNFTMPAAAKLTVTKANTGTGTVTSSPAGIACGTDCTDDYAKGTSVTLTAAANPSSLFTGWSGGCTGGAATCTVSMTAAKTVTATFKPAFALTVTNASVNGGAGTVTSNVAGISCGADCGEEYASGTSVVLTAARAAGSTFVGWSGACTSTATTCTVSMTAAKSVTATFRSP